MNFNNPPNNYFNLNNNTRGLKKQMSSTNLFEQKDVYPDINEVKILIILERNDKVQNRVKLPLSFRMFELYYVAIEFKIVGSDGNYVGMMKKMGASGPSEYFSKADSYTISFPSGATPEEKMLLICAGLLIDYQNFENDTSEKNRGKQGF